MSKPNVTVLDKSMVCIGPYKRGKCGCLFYWRDTDYRPPDDHVRCCEVDLIYAMGYPAVTLESHEGVYTRAELAQVRNRATALMRLGKDNPEAEWAEANRKKFREILEYWGMW